MVPLWTKIVYLVFVAVLAPAYTWEHGLGNFLWFSNIALLLGLVATWTEHRLLASTQLVSIFFFEMFWITGFIAGAARGGRPLFGLTDYMFDPDIALFVRVLSLYHLVLPFYLLWLAARLGYDRRAWWMWTPIGWAVLTASFLFTSPDRNVNWVFGPAGEAQQWMPAWVWLMVVIPAFTAAWWLTHRVLLALLGWATRRGWVSAAAVGGEPLGVASRSNPNKD
jgi:hypothetical protein